MINEGSGPAIVYNVCHGQEDSVTRDPRCLVPQQVWYSFIDSEGMKDCVNLAQSGV